ncbi:CsbD family protein [Telmatospirillum siberiense]|uniref:CsbD family protein n=1 Tax=Telmatospirillum siberiense TaxID=382514 RepID=A0A2N3PRS3_9PROT|nr:CsbD family protein [Telmatospirillum siberiense]PKU23084.1 CsbD family protein [Telmatospirillum siberiense]
MDKDRIVGAAKEVKGAIEEAVGNVIGDAKMVADGKKDKVEGKAQNAIGSAKDIAKEALKK